MDKRRIWWGKNRRSFASALIRAAEDDGQVTKMFSDNFNREWDGDADKAAKKIAEEIKKGNFKEALSKAFKWSETPEGLIFWTEVYNNLNDLN